MPKQEEKYCPLCQKIFECKVGNITECQCFEVQLSEDIQGYFQQKGFTDCLCRNCLEALQMKSVNNKRISTDS